MAEAKLFEAALGIEPPWFVRDVAFDAKARTLTIIVDFKPGTRFGVPGVAGERPVHDTTVKRYRHLNFFQHECFLEVRVPRVKLAHGNVRQAEPAFVGRLAGFTLLFEALILAFCREMRWTLKSSHHLSAAAREDLDGLIGAITSKRTARAWVYRGPLREILTPQVGERRAPDAKAGCTSVSRSKVEPMKAWPASCEPTWKASRSPSGHDRKQWHSGPRSPDCHALIAVL